MKYMSIRSAESDELVFELPEALAALAAVEDIDSQELPDNSSVEKRNRVYVLVYDTSDNPDIKKIEDDLNLDPGSMEIDDWYGIFYDSIKRVSKDDEIMLKWLEELLKSFSFSESIMKIQEYVY